jgi:hypothetical protein
MSVTENNVTTNYYNSTVVSGSSAGVPALGGGKSGDLNPSGEGASSSAASSASNSASGGGSCSDAPPTCSGDAILCASLKQDWQLSCNVAVPTEEQVFGPGGAPHGVPSQTISLSTTLDDSSFLADASCPADKHVNVLGHDVPIPTGPMCSLLSLLSNLVMAVAYFSAARIIYRVI